jgi:Cdc6-like AAA superfamily ATPase
MPNKEINDINDFFTTEEQGNSPKERWDKIFIAWINKIEEKKLTLTLFELKLWIESLEEFFKSEYLDNLTVNYDGINTRNYKFHTQILYQICSKLIHHLKELDFKKDPLYTNFEEFVVVNLMNKQLIKELSYVKDNSSPESWFNSTKIFLQNFRIIISDVLKNDVISQKTFTAVRKLYHKAMAENPIIISLLERKFIPKIDKTYQKDISNIVSSIEDKALKRDLGIFFILSFRIVKINNFIETNLNKTRDKGIVIPLIIFLKKNMLNMIYFYKEKLQSRLTEFAKDKKGTESGEIKFGKTQTRHCFANAHAVLFGD